MLTFNAKFKDYKMRYFNKHVNYKAKYKKSINEKY